MIITKPTIEDFDELTELWEASVRSTHHFLPETYIRFLKPLIPNYLSEVEIYSLKDESNKVAAFMGLSEEVIEMLFVHPDRQGKGYGSTLINFAIQEKNRWKIDVNEQNEKAYHFYLNKGFRVIGRDALDPMGKPFPILHMEFYK